MHIKFNVKLINKNSYVFTYILQQIKFTKKYLCFIILIFIVKFEIL